MAVNYTGYLGQAGTNRLPLEKGHNLRKVAVRKDTKYQTYIISFFPVKHKRSNSETEISGRLRNCRGELNNDSNCSNIEYKLAVYKLIMVISTGR